MNLFITTYTIYISKRTNFIINIKCIHIFSFFFNCYYSTLSCILRIIFSIMQILFFYSFLFFHSYILLMLNLFSRHIFIISDYLIYFFFFLSFFTFLINMNVYYIHVCKKKKLIIFFFFFSFTNIARPFHICSFNMVSYLLGLYTCILKRT